MRALFTLIIILFLQCGAYASDNITDDNKSSFISDFSLTVGVLSFIVPRYEGSNEIRYINVPNIMPVYKRFVFITPFGIGANIFLSKHFMVGGVIGKDFFGLTGDRTIRGLSNNEKGVVLTPYVRFMLNKNFYTTVSAYKAIAGSDSLMIDLKIGYNFNITDDFSIGVSLKGAWADKKYMMLKFGITPEQSLVSGFEVYSPGSDFKSAEVAIDARYKFTEKLTATIGYSEGRLFNQAANSPTTFIKRVPRAVFMIGYKFGK